MSCCETMIDAKVYDLICWYLFYQLKCPSGHLLTQSQQSENRTLYEINSKLTKAPNAVFNIREIWFFGHFCQP